MDQWNLLGKNISHSRTQNGSFEDWIFSLQGDFFMRSWHDTIVAGHISHVRSDGQPGAIFYKKRRWRDSALLSLSLLLFFLRFCSSRSSCLVLSVHCLARSVTMVIRCTARRGKKFTCYIVTLENLMASTLIYTRPRRLSPATNSAQQKFVSLLLYLLYCRLL